MKYFIERARLIYLYARKQPLAKLRIHPMFVFTCVTKQHEYVGLTYMPIPPVCHCIWGVF